MYYELALNSWIRDALPYISTLKAKSERGGTPPPIPIYIGLKQSNWDTINILNTSNHITSIKQEKPTKLIFI